MTKRKQEVLIKGKSSHLRTESDYLSTLLDSMSLDDWREVIDVTLQAAKIRDAKARNWLAHHLVGNPQNAAPTPLHVVVQQWSGINPVVEQLAQPFINHHSFPSLNDDEEFEKTITELIATELDNKLPKSEQKTDKQSY